MKATKTLYTSHGTVGEKYDRSLDIKDVAKIVKKTLKGQFPKCKFSVRIDRYSGGQSLHIHLMSAPFSPFAEPSEAVASDPRINRYGDSTAKFLENWGRTIQNGCTGINQYYIDDSYILSDAGKKVAHAMKAAAEAYNYDDSDAMIDYFDVNFYLTLEIGKWNKPFQLTA